jgi:hypothetical protein
VAIFSSGASYTTLRTQLAALVIFASTEGQVLIPNYNEKTKREDADILFVEDVKDPSEKENAPSTAMGESCKAAANEGPEQPQECYQYRQSVKFDGTDHPHDVIGPITMRRNQFSGTGTNRTKVYSWSGLVHELGHLLFAMGHEYIRKDGKIRPVCMRSFMENKYYLNACTEHDHMFESRSSSYHAEFFESWPEFNPERQEDEYPGGSVWDWMFFMGFTHQVPLNTGSNMPDPYNFLDFGNDTIGNVNWLN